MAYMSQEKKKTLAPKIKAILKEYGMKGTIGVDRHSTLVVNIQSGPLFEDVDGDSLQVNVYWVKDHYEGKERSFLMKLVAAMNEGNYDNSDIMTDYFDVGWYNDINIGKWNKKYQFAP